ncbi:MAG: flavin reductase family protein [Candidatus Geothermarchaeales archaeon]
MKKTYSPVPLSRFHRLFYPIVATVVTSRQEEDVGGMAAVSYVPLSFDPPLVGVSIQPGHRTHRLVSASGYFAINWVDRAHADKIEAMGSPTERRVKDKIKACDFTHHPGQEAPVPVVDQAVAALECRVRERHRTGDHDLFVGEVLAAYTISDFEEYWRFEGYSPALYAGSTESEKGETRLRFLELDVG